MLSKIPPYLKFTAGLAIILELLFAATGAVRPIAKLPAPDETRVAIFGESPMRGFGSPRSTEDILKHELERLYPGRKFYVRNFAQLGMIFGGYQSKILLWELAKYDAVFIYAGLSEHSLYAQHSGIFKAPGEPLDKPPRPPSRLSYAFGQWVDAHVRLYAAWTKVAAFVQTRTAGITPPFSLNRFQLSRAEFQPALIPEYERRAIQERYRAALREISSAAAAMNKHVVVSEVLLHESAKPLASELNPALSPQDQDRMQDLYRRGRDKAAAGDCARALPLLKAAAAMDESAAIVRHHLGLCLLSQGRVDAARQELQRAIELDLLPLRYAGPLNRIAREVADGDHLRYLELDTPYATLLKRGYSYDEFFNDFEHPAMLGHVFLASNFLCALSKLPGFSGPAADPCRDWKRQDLRALANEYEKALGVTNEERREMALMIAKWHFSTSSLTAYPEDFYAASERDLNKALALPGADARLRQDAALLLGLIDLQRGAPARARERFEAALNLNPARWRRLWSAPLAGGRTMETLCRPFGLSFDPIDLKFRPGLTAPAPNKYIVQSVNTR